MSQEVTKFDRWGVVDVMGHQRYIGRITEEVIAGCGFVRVDVPENGDQPAFTKLIGTSSVYAISPMEESLCRQLAAQRKQTPIESFQLSEALRGLPAPDDDDEDDEYSDRDLFG
jgi:hypothetical protein